MGVLTLNSSHDTLSYGVVASDHVVVASIGCQINNYVFASPGYLDVNATTTVKNCIFYGYSSLRLGEDLQLTASNCYFSMVEASVVASTNSVLASSNCYFNATPAFRNVSLYGYRLRGGSGAIKTGVPIGGLTGDMDGRSLPATPSIGAYEYTSTPSAATFFVRYASLVEECGDGTSFYPATSFGGKGAWRKFSDIQWGGSAASLGPGKRLYVCGSAYETLTVNDSGNSTNRIEIYGNYNEGAGYIKASPSCLDSNSKSYLSISNLKTRAGGNHNINVDGGKDVVIRNCAFENSATAVKVTTATNVTIHHNIFNAGTIGVSVDGCATTYLYHNTFYNYKGDAVLSQNNISSPIWVKNNIIASCESGIIFREATAGLDEDYNYLSRCAKTASTFILGANTASTNTLPKFVYRHASNFHLRYDSPCIGTGVDVGLATDYDGIIITGLPDIGAYDQKSAGYWFDNQYRTGVVNVTLGSRLVIGNFETNWTPANAAIQKGHLFRLDYNNAPYYVVGTVLNATNIQLRERYKGRTHTAHPYMVTRYVTACRGYANVFQGDYDFADVCKEQIVDEIDNDIGLLYGRGPATPTATLVLNSARYGARVFNQASYFDFKVPASRVLEFYFKGEYRGFVGTTTGSWIPVK